MHTCLAWPTCYIRAVRCMCHLQAGRGGRAAGVGMLESLDLTAAVCCVGRRKEE
jgi:hypothetical protein